MASALIPLQPQCSPYLSDNMDLSGSLRVRAVLGAIGDKLKPRSAD